MKITIEDEAGLNSVTALDQGTCFRSSRPASDQVYMITERSHNAGRDIDAISLKNGRYYSFSRDQQVQVVMCELLVRRMA